MRTPTEDDKLWAGYGFGGLTFTACIAFSWLCGEDPYLQSLLCLFGGVAGWTAGIVATPLDEDERTKFSDIAKGFLALGSGFVIAKLEGPLVTSAENMITQHIGLLTTRVLLFSVCLLVGFLFTLVTRLYGETDAAKKKKKLAHLLSQAEDISAKLAKARA